MNEQTIGMIMGAGLMLSACSALLAAYLKGRRDAWQAGHAEGYQQGLQDGYEEADEEAWDEGPCDAPSRFTLKTARKLLH